MADKYIYAVARIRALEMSLFSQAVIEQLIAQKTYADCLQFLGEKGWGDHFEQGTGKNMDTGQGDGIRSDSI